MLTIFRFPYHMTAQITYCMITSSISIDTTNLKTLIKTKITEMKLQGINLLLDNKQKCNIFIGVLYSFSE